MPEFHLFSSSLFFSHVTLSSAGARRPEFASHSRSLCLTIPSHTISVDGLTLKTQAHWRAARRSVAHDTGARRDQLAHVLAVRALLGRAGESTLVLSASRHLGPHPDSTASRTNSCLSLPCSEWRVDPPAGQRLAPSISCILTYIFYNTQADGNGSRAVGNAGFPAGRCKLETCTRWYMSI
jgi:hypothetical protein